MILPGKKLFYIFIRKIILPDVLLKPVTFVITMITFLKKGFAVVGVSPDSEKSHKSFAGKYSLPFPLIADTSKKIVTDYGVWGEKKMYGKSFMGVIRTTFIIDEKGIIEKIITKVDTAGHTEQIFKLYN